MRTHYEDKNTENDNEELEVATCKPIPKSNEATHCLGTYHHFLSGIPDMPIIKNLWKLQHFYSNLFKRQVKQAMLDTDLKGF